MSSAADDKPQLPVDGRNGAIDRFCKRWRVDEFDHRPLPAANGAETLAGVVPVAVLLRFTSKGRWRFFDLAVMRAELERLFNAPVHLFDRRALDDSRNRYRRDPAWDPAAGGRDAEYLTDILNSAKLAVNHLGTVDRSRFIDDIRCQDAVLHRLAIMGETAARLSPAVRSLFPELVWEGLITVRDIVHHQHDALGLGTIWEAVRRDLPILIRALEQHLEERY